MLYISLLFINPITRIFKDIRVRIFCSDRNLKFPLLKNALTQLLLTKLDLNFLLVYNENPLLFLAFLHGSI